MHGAPGQFLSTLSLRRATRRLPRASCSGLNFYPRSPCGERHGLSRIRPALQHFYPRSPCGERHRSATGYFTNPRFLSTLSLRRATFVRGILRLLHRDFYPRSPCGERLLSGCLFNGRAKFLSTLSLRRATGIQSGAQQATAISIHALLAESDAPEIGFVAFGQSISIHALLAESDPPSVI